MDANELLRSYAVEKSEPAFTEFVSRHLNLVYSAALRQVGGNPHLASEVAQKVFTDAARKSRSLASHPAIPAWLFTSAHLAAAAALRAEARRLRREHQAYAMSVDDSATEPAVDWAEMRSVIDAAMHRLGDRERAALVLRYFERLPVADIGRRFGMSDRGARKLVERGLERLRGTLARHGITSTSTALAAALAESAVSAAPSGIAAGVSQAALAGAAGGWTGSLLVIPFMTTMQKSLVAFAAIAVLGGYVATETLIRQRSENNTLREQKEALVRRERDLRRERDEARQLVKSAASISNGSGAPAVSGEAASEEDPEALLAAKISRMKALFNSGPEQKIPELDLLADNEWAAVLRELKLESPSEIQDAMSKLRNASTRKALGLFAQAIRAAQLANGEGSVTDVQHLADFFQPALPTGLLDRYEVTTNSDGRRSLNEKRSAIVDPVRDDWHQQSIVAPGQGGFGFSGNALQTDLGQARKAYAAANNGAQATTMEQLAPYLQSSIAADSAKGK